MSKVCRLFEVDYACFPSYPPAACKSLSRIAESLACRKSRPLVPLVPLAQTRQTAGVRRAAPTMATPHSRSPPTSSTAALVTRERAVAAERVGAREGDARSSGGRRTCGTEGRFGYLIATMARLFEARHLYGGYVLPTTEEGKSKVATDVLL